MLAPVFGGGGDGLGLVRERNGLLGFGPPGFGPPGFGAGFFVSSHGEAFFGHAVGDKGFPLTTGHSFIPQGTGQDGFCYASDGSQHGKRIACTLHPDLPLFITGKIG